MRSEVVIGCIPGRFVGCIRCWAGWSGVKKARSHAPEADGLERSPCAGRSSPGD